VKRLVVTVHHDGHWTASELDATEASNGISGILWLGELDDTPALGAARVGVGDDLGGVDGTDLLEGSAEHLGSDAPWEVANDNLEAGGVLGLALEGWVTTTGWLGAGGASSAWSARGTWLLLWLLVEADEEGTAWTREKR